MSLRLYESIYILSPQASPEKVDSVVKKIEGMIKETEGEILKTEKWGLKKLAYLVKKFSEGYYLYFLYEAKPGTTRDIEMKLKFDEEILRFLSVAVEKAREADTRKKAEEKPQPPEAPPAPAPAPVQESIKERLSKVDLVTENEEDETTPEQKESGPEEQKDQGEIKPAESADSKGPKESTEH